MATETMKQAIQEYIDNRTPVPVSFEPYTWTDNEEAATMRPAERHLVPFDGGAVEIGNDQLSIAAWIWWEHEGRNDCPGHGSNRAPCVLSLIHI